VDEANDRDRLRARFTRNLATDVNARLRQEDRDPNHDFAHSRDNAQPIVGARGPGVDYLSIKARLHARLLDEIGERSMYGSGEEAISRAARGEELPAEFQKLLALPSPRIRLKLKLANQRDDDPMQRSTPPGLAHLSSDRHKWACSPSRCPRAPSGPCAGRGNIGAGNLPSSCRNFLRGCAVR
jgi:hypothetical protein